MKWNWIVENKKLLKQEVYLSRATSGGHLCAAIAYPNLYKIGMSNLGLHAAYQFFNKKLGLSCERVFYPEKHYIPFFLQDKNLRSVETQKPLGDFDLIGFSVSFELDYFNIAAMLKMTQIPLFAKDRKNNDPFVFCGGAITFLNPEPVADFMDFIILGRIEHTAPEIFAAIKTEGNRTKILETLSAFENIYVPSIHNIHNPVKKHTSGIAPYFFSSAILTENTEFKNTFLTEIMTGCPYSCNFCAVGNCFGKLSYRPFEDFKETIEVFANNIQKIGLIGASINTHPEFPKIIDFIEQKGLKAGFASLRADKLNDRAIDFAVKHGGGILTLAPESGNELLRSQAGKSLKDIDLYETLNMAVGKGIHTIKLYFMTGLPGEKETDVIHISKMLHNISDLKKGKNLSIHVSVSPFVPKPKTFFERERQDTEQESAAKIKIIKENSPKNIKISSENPSESILQGILSRGGRELSKLLADLSGDISLRRFLKSASQKDIDITNILKPKNNEEILPWAHIHGESDADTKR